MERSSSSEERQYTLQELADSAGVSIRTIRYYIGEGLLPGPEGAGSQSHYTESHRHRLRAIALLKDRFLPLREIRRQLTGLDDAAIDRLIAELGDDLPPDSEPVASAPMGQFDTALDYVDSALSPGRRSFRARRQDRTAPTETSERWVRIAIVDGVELLVREDRYRLRKDQIDWLTEWAKKVVE